MYQQAVKADLAVSQREFFYPESEVVSGALRNFPIDSWSPDQIVLSCQRYFSRVLVIPSNSFELPYLERLLDLTEMFQISDAGAISGSERRRNTSLSAGQVRAIENVNLALREAIRIAAAVFPARLSELLVRSLLYLKAASLNVLTRRDGTANRLALIPEVEMSWKLISRSNPICRGIWGSASHREFNR